MSTAGESIEPSKGTELAEIQDIVRTLLTCDTGLDVDEETRLCHRLLGSLRRVKAAEDFSSDLQSSKTSLCSDPGFIRTNIANYNNKSHTENRVPAATLCVRDVVGSMQSDSLSKLPALLTELMAARVDLDALLPATQDRVANMEAMGRSAVTLTKRSFIAATLYATLLGTPGAWGAGLIDVGAVSGLAALLRRWNVECMGFGQRDLDDHAHDRKRGGSNLSSPPATKRAKKKRPVVMDLSDEEISEVSSFNAGDWDDMDDDSIEGDDEHVILSPRDLVNHGLQLSRALGPVLLQRDFMSWSEESREAIVDAVVTAMLASAALTMSRSRSKVSRSVFQDADISNLGQQAANGLSDALQKCLAVSSTPTDEDDDTSDGKKLAERHETSVFILRGMLPGLSVQVGLPNGQDGLLAGLRIAQSTLVGLVGTVTKDYTSIVVPITPTTPKLTTSMTRVSSDAITPATAHKARKRRVSFGGIESDSSEKQAPPTLKGANTPLRSRSHLAAGLTPVQKNGRPRPILSAVVGMLQKLATSTAIERASVRTSIVDTLQESLPQLPLLERDCLLRFILHLCHSKVSHHRLTASEVLGRILSSEWLWEEHSTGRSSPFESASRVNRASFSPIVESSSENMAMALFRALQGRLLDKSSVVRAHAASCIGETTRKLSSTEDVTSSSCASFEAVFASVFNELTSMLRKRAVRDDKATVRKNAVSSLVQVLSFRKATLYTSESDISVLSRVCTDPSVSVRKAAADALTVLLQQAYEVSSERLFLLEDAWTASVLPLVLDGEPACSEKAVDVFAAVVVGPLVDAARAKGTAADVQRSTPAYLSSWRILARIHESYNQQGATRRLFGALKVVLQKLDTAYSTDIFQDLLLEMQTTAKDTFSEKKSLFTEDVSRTKAIGVWCLLDSSTDHEKPLVAVTNWKKRRSSQLDFLVVSWDMLLNILLSSNEQDECVPSVHMCMCACLRVLSELATSLPLGDISTLASTLKSLLGTFTFPSQITGAAVTALVTFTKRLHSTDAPSQLQHRCSEWIRGLCKLCEDEISSFISVKAKPDEAAVCRVLFLIGELCMVGFRADENTSSQAGILPKGSSGAEDLIAGLYVRPSSRLMRLVQSVLPKHLPLIESSPNAELIATPDAVRAHAFITLGKLCLRDESLAKDCLNILARELHQNMSDNCVSVQSNALMVLGDLCVKYTNLVDRQLPILAACLQSGSTDTENYDLFDSRCEGTGLVRKHAVLLLSSLLLQDYIKWRGLLFHRFLVASADNDDGVAELAEMTLTGPLLSKHPKLFFNNFVESIFVLNRCTAHPVYASAASSGDNGAGITVGFDGINLSGELGRAKRHQMYKMMLSHMSDEEKIGITARIAKDVLGAALDSEGGLGRVCRETPGSRTTPNGKESPEDRAFSVMSDSFSILTSSSLQVGRRTDTEEDVADPTVDIVKATHAAVAKGKLLSKISRKHLIEIVLPILCKLKSLLHTSCSPLLKDLMAFLVEIFRVYKTEVKEFLANDPTLLLEIEYDARQFKKTSSVITPRSESRLLAMPVSLATLE